MKVVQEKNISGGSNPIFSTAKEHVDSYYLENNLGEPQVVEAARLQGN